jgi:nicotinamidase-related amidase
VHPWGVDDGQGWRTTEPAGVVDFCTVEKNDLRHEHIVKVLNPFLKKMRGKVQFVMYSQPGNEDPIRKKMYRSFRTKPTDKERAEGAKELHKKLNDFDYNHGGALPETLELSKDTPSVDYFKQFPGIDSSDRYDPKGFWELPIPVVKPIDVDPDDVLIYDAEGYPALKDFLKKNGIRHVILTGYCADMCFKGTTAGYMNLSQDFDTFLVADATLATFPSNRTPRFATNATISYAALDHLITQVSWVKLKGEEKQARSK